MIHPKLHGFTPFPFQLERNPFAWKEPTMEGDIPRQDWQRIEKAIASAESPVGIDAKKTHVIILHKLEQIEKRLERLERAAESHP